MARPKVALLRAVRTPFHLPLHCMPWPDGPGPALLNSGPSHSALLAKSCVPRTSHTRHFWGCRWLSRASLAAWPAAPPCRPPHRFRRAPGCGCRGGGRCRPGPAAGMCSNAQGMLGVDQRPQEQGMQKCRLQTAGFELEACCRAFVHCSRLCTCIAHLPGCEGHQRHHRCLLKAQPCRHGGQVALAHRRQLGIGPRRNVREERVGAG